MRSWASRFSSPLRLQLSLPREHLLLRVGQHAVESAQDGQRQDNVLVLAALERVADQVGDAPEEADDLAVVHVLLSLWLQVGAIAAAR